MTTQAPIPVLGILHYNRPDLTLRLLQSIDYPVAKVVLIDQSVLPENELDNERFADAFGDEVWILRHPNAGVAGGWNEIIKLFPAAYWMIANNDIAFAPGDLRRMHESVKDRMQGYICPVCSAEFQPKEINITGRIYCHRCSPSGEDNRPENKLTLVNPGILYGNHGASWFSITKHGVDTAGLFDENIHPAYLEDCDMSYRMDLLGVRRMDVAGCASIHGCEPHGQSPAMTGSCTVQSDPDLSVKNGETHGRNFDYYIAKWGGRNGEEKYKTPFKQPNWPVWAWRFDTGFRARQQW